MSEEWNWYWGVGSQPEVYHAANSREDAIEMATEDATDNDYDTMTVCEGKRWSLNDAVFDADSVLEWWHDANEEGQDEDGELGMAPTPEQKRELEVVLTLAFSGWRAKHKLGRAWALDTRNEEIISVPVAQES